MLHDTKRWMPMKGLFQVEMIYLHRYLRAIEQWSPFKCIPSNTLDSNNRNNISIQLQVTVNLNFKTMTSIAFNSPHSFLFIFITIKIHLPFSRLQSVRITKLNRNESFSIIELLSPLSKHTQLQKALQLTGLFFRRSLIENCAVHLFL